MKKLTLFLCCLGVIAAASAQNPPAMEPVFNGKLPVCGFNRVLQKTGISYSELLRNYRPGNARAKTTNVLYDIPVVVHVVYNKPSHNIPDSVVVNQIEVLSKAFRNSHDDTGNTRAFFKPLAGDANIQFHLATTDPSGQPTNGITRTLSSRTYFGDPNVTVDSFERIKHTAQGGIDPWPTERYLNIWIGNLVDSSGSFNVLGYAIPPLNPIPSNWPIGDVSALAGIIDGVVLQVHAVGSNNPLAASLQGLASKGRTAVHEVGHYLGLQHIFGSNDGTSSTGSCGAIADDGMGDTPEQSVMSYDANSTVSCPPATKNTCGSGATDLPDMWENYMDYARDACQVMFTHDQIALIRSVLGNQRSTLFEPSAITDEPYSPAAVMLYPNPATDVLMVRDAENIDRLEIVSMVGQKLLRLEGTAAEAGTYNISKIPAGNYLVVLYKGNSFRTAKLQISR